MSTGIPITQSGDFTAGSAEADFGTWGLAEGSASITISAWIYASSYAAQVILLDSDTGFTGGFELRIYTTDNIGLRMRNGGSLPYVRTNTSPLVADAWNHIVATYSAGTVVIYINGVSQAVTVTGTMPATNGAPTGTTFLSLGYPGSSAFAGLISNPAIWSSTVASAAQALEIYDTGRVHDLTAMPTLAAPTWWARLNGTWVAEDATEATVTNAVFSPLHPPGLILVEAVSALEQTAAANGKAIMLGANALRSYLTLPEWSTARTWATGASGGGTNVSRTDSPTRWVQDDRMQSRSRPSTDAGTSMFLLFDLSNASADAIVIANHTFADIAGCTVRFGVADDSAYTENLRILAEWTAFGSQRLAAIDLTDDGAHGAGEFARVSAIRYAYLEVTTTGTFGTTVPYVGEIFFGTRRQLSRVHNYPGDERALASRVDDFEAYSGDVSRLVRHTGRRVADLTWTADSTDTLDDIATWRALYSTDLDYGTRPVWYLRDPATPEDAPLILADPVQNFENLGPNHADRAFSGRELPPFFEKETAP